MKYHADIKLVITADNINETQPILKQILTRMIDTPNIDIFLRDPGSERYDKVTH